jgi:hypothetical protein
VKLVTQLSLVPRYIIRLALLTNVSVHSELGRRVGAVVANAMCMVRLHLPTETRRLPPDVSSNKLPLIGQH